MNEKTSAVDRTYSISDRMCPVKSFCWSCVVEEKQKNWGLFVKGVLESCWGSCNHLSYSGVGLI